jgi:hypothetical protein
MSARSNLERPTTPATHLTPPPGVSLHFSDTRSSQCRSKRMRRRNRREPFGSVAATGRRRKIVHFKSAPLRRSGSRLVEVHCIGSKGVRVVSPRLALSDSLYTRTAKTLQQYRLNVERHDCVPEGDSQSDTRFVMIPCTVPVSGPERLVVHLKKAASPTLLRRDGWRVYRRFDWDDIHPS